MKYALFIARSDETKLQIAGPIELDIKAIAVSTSEADLNSQRDVINDVISEAGLVDAAPSPIMAFVRQVTNAVVIGSSIEQVSGIYGPEV